MTPRLKIILFCLITVVLIGCDRVTKDLAKEHLQFREPLSYLHHTVTLVYAENTGAALSFADDLPRTAAFWLLSMLPLAFLCGLMYYTLSRSKQLPFARMVFFSMLIAGGLGNIIDRIAFDRHVTDFMVLGIGRIQTGIFNVADLCVTTGAIGLMFALRDKNTIATSTVHSAHS